MTTDKRSSELPNVPTLKESVGDFARIRCGRAVVGPDAVGRAKCRGVEQEVLAADAGARFPAPGCPAGCSRAALNASQSEHMASEFDKWSRLAPKRRASSAVKKAVISP